AGVPLLVTWNYVSGYTCGSYTIVGPDRSQMITTTAAKSLGNTAILLLLSQIVDRNGNGINFLYGTAGTYGFPMLSAITDKNNSNLVTFSRDSTTGNVTAINDRYSRSIYYSVSTYSNVNT